MAVIGEVELRFAGHAGDTGTDPGQDFLAWLARAESQTEPGLSGAPVMQATDTGFEVVGLLVTLDSQPALGVLAAALATWLNTRRSDVTVKLSASGKTAELRGETEAADIDRILRSLLSPPSLFGLPNLVDSQESAYLYTPGLGGYQARTLFGIPVRDTTVAGAPLRINPGVPDRPPGFRLFNRDEQGSEEADATTTPITIYLSDEGIHQQVEEALETALAAAGLQIESRDDPILGSWFRRMRAVLKEVARSPAAHEAAFVAAHAADTRLVLAQDAAVTATLLQNLGPVLGALQPTKDAVIRTGALLIVKVDWIVNVYQLTAAQQVLLNHRPQLARSPHEIVEALSLVPDESQQPRD